MVQDRLPIQGWLGDSDRFWLLRVGGHIEPIGEAEPEIDHHVANPDVGEDRPAREGGIKGGKGSVCPVVRVVIAPRRKDREGNDEEWTEEEEQRRGGAILDFRRARKRDLLASERLLERLQHASEVDRQEDQVKAIHAQDVRGLIATVL